MIPLFAEKKLNYTDRNLGVVCHVHERIAASPRVARASSPAGSAAPSWSWAAISAARLAVSVHQLYSQPELVERLSVPAVSSER